MIRVMSAVACVGCLCGAVVAMPLDVSSVTGTATLRVGNSGFGPPTVETTPIAFSEVVSRSLTSIYTGAGAQLDYTLGPGPVTPLGESALFEFYAVDTTGSGGDESNGFIDVDMTFTTHTDTIFSFTAVDPVTSGQGYALFWATFNGIVASKYFDRSSPNGGVGGTFPADPNPPFAPPSDTFFATGYLPAGTYDLTIDQGGSYRGAQHSIDTSVTLRLDPIPEFHTLLLAMMGLSGLAMWRRRHVE